MGEKREREANWPFEEDFPLFLKGRKRGSDGKVKVDRYIEAQGTQNEA
jgi:hypothetical protein